MGMDNGPTNQHTHSQLLQKISGSIYIVVEMGARHMGYEELFQLP